VGPKCPATSGRCLPARKCVPVPWPISPAHCRWLGRSLLGRHASRASPPQGYGAASAVKAVQHLPLARNVPNSSAARDKGEGRGLHQRCMRHVGRSPRRGGHFPTHVPTSEPSEKVPCCEVVVRFPIRLYFPDGSSGLFGLHFGHFPSPPDPTHPPIRQSPDKRHGTSTLKMHWQDEAESEKVR